MEIKIFWALVRIPQISFSFIFLFHTISSQVNTSPLEKVPSANGSVPRKGRKKIQDFLAPVFERRKKVWHDSGKVFSSWYIYLVRAHLMHTYLHTHTHTYAKHRHSSLFGKDIAVPYQFTEILCCFSPEKASQVSNKTNLFFKFVSLPVFLLLPFYAIWFYTLVQRLLLQITRSTLRGQFFPRENILESPRKSFKSVFKRVDALRAVQKTIKRRFGSECTIVNIISRFLYIRDNIIRVRYVYWYCDQMSISTTAQGYRYFTILCSSVISLRFRIPRFGFYMLKLHLDFYSCWHSSDSWVFSARYPQL